MCYKPAVAGIPKTCPNCGATNFSYVTVCRECGAEFPADSFVCESESETDNGSEFPADTTSQHNLCSS